LMAAQANEANNATDETPAKVALSRALRLAVVLCLQIVLTQWPFFNREVMNEKFREHAP
jgi:hypothetical protein